MKNISLYLILTLSLLFGCSTLRPHPENKADELENVSSETDYQGVDFSLQSTWLLGYFPLGRLAAEPYSSWYIKGFDEYTPESDVIKKLQDIGNENLAIKIVLGTWCADSRREVPRFMRILDIWRFPTDKVIFIGVDDAKLSPVGEYIDLDIQRVPTFIIYEKNIEAGRIIENPKTSLEQDMVNILTGNE